MSGSIFRIAAARPQDSSAVARLLDQVFGPGRFARTAYRLRERSSGPAAKLSFCAWQGEKLAGSIAFWPIRIGPDPALLLGPLVVAPDFQGKGAGLALINAGCEAAKDSEAGLILLVGDPPYYARAGFVPVAPGAITLPGPVDPSRLLVRALISGARDVRGPVRGPVRGHVRGEG